MKYIRITAEERDLIGKMRYAGRSIRYIASELMRSPSTIYRELRLYSPSLNYYNSQVAGMEAKERASQRNNSRKIDKNPVLKELILEKLRCRWSPQQISKYLHRHYSNDPSMQISPESIYTYLYVLPRGELKKRNPFLFEAKTQTSS